MNILIIAIPKSASTSLMLTLAGHFNFKCGQYFPSKNEIKKYDGLLADYHSDIGEFSEPLLCKLLKENYVSKQHVYPSKRNLELFKHIKKVVLMRKPESICLAYQRGVESGQHKLRGEFKLGLSEEAWMSECKTNGLLEQLNEFYEIWLANLDENTLVLHYDEYLKAPKEALERIAGFYNLEVNSASDFTPVSARKTDNKSVTLKRRLGRLANVIRSYWRFFS